MDLKRYNEAVLAVEKAFSYDAENKKASKLMDEIKIHALQDGQQEVLVRQEMARGEITDRVTNYLEQAQAYIKAGSWGAARMTVDKIMLLQPENKKAIKLQKKILSHNQKTTGVRIGAKTGTSSSSEPTGPMEVR